MKADHVSQAKAVGWGGINSCVRLALVEVKDTYCMPREWMSVKCLYSCSEDYYYHETTQL